MQVNRPQGAFLKLPHKFRAYVAGFRGGKTFVGCISQLMHYSRFPNIPQGYFAPTYPQIRDIFYPTVEEVAHYMGMRVRVRVGDKEVDIFRGGKNIGTTICRSMSKPETLIGFKIGQGLIDEIDTMATDKATDAWRKVIARMSIKGDGLKNGLDVTSTPEGYRFIYNQFKLNPTENYGLIQASTRDNAKNLPDDYISSLLETYPAELIDAYLDGQFRNLTSGSVYTSYDKERCNSYETIKGRERLYIGQDFNVNQMASVVHVKRGNEYHAVCELVDLRDTPDVISHIKERWPENPITIYPDSSGKNSSSKNSSVSDISLLRDAGFTVLYKSTNPFIKDRVLAMNAALEKGQLRVNYNRCPEYSKCLEQQAYDKNGAPDKTSGTDHMVDAGGYLIAYELPINKPQVKSLELVGGY